MTSDDLTGDLLNELERLIVLREEVRKRIRSRPHLHPLNSEKYFSDGVAELAALNEAIINIKDVIAAPGFPIEKKKQTLENARTIR